MQYRRGFWRCFSGAAFLVLLFCRGFFATDMAMDGA
jgi:hypothetical protein